MEKGRQLFNKIRKAKTIPKDVESTASEESFYNFITEDLLEERPLYPSDKLEEIKEEQGHDELVEILENTKKHNIEPIGVAREDIYQVREEIYQTPGDIYQAKEDIYNSKEDIYKSKEDIYKSKEDIYHSNIEDILDKSKLKEQRKNIDKYLSKNNHVCHYIFDKKKKNNYTMSENVFRNSVVFNFKHERFNNNVHDPWLFTSLKNVKWPDFVTRLFYTKLTPTGNLVCLSYVTNLYLNKLFLTQSYAPVLRLFHYPIYELASKLSREPTFEEIKREYINETFIMEHGNIEVIEKSGNIIRDFNTETPKKMRVYDINDEQPTDIAFCSFYDYVPICFYFSKKNENGVYNFEDPNKLIFSNICFHKNNCHDYWRETHNPYSISHLYKHPHLENQPLFDIKDQKSLDFYQYINNNGA